jgi:hypothetical protein
MSKIMSFSVRWPAMAVVLVLACCAARLVSAQGNPAPYSFKFNSGQSVQPIFEGWARNADGTFTMYFGYINRNYVETPSIPVGPDNTIEPGVPDRGQPTLFDTRIHRMAFSVSVPSDWGKKELVWTLTLRGVSEKAVAWLQPEWEIDPIYGGKARDAESLANTPPTMMVDAPAAVTLPDTLRLAATVTDDGLPKPKAARPRAVGQETPPALKPDPDQTEIVLSLPQVESRRRPAMQGLVVRWVVWRGPADATFTNEMVPAKDGKAVVTATFTTPGTYVLRATATDGELRVSRDVRVKVIGSAGN